MTGWSGYERGFSFIAEGLRGEIEYGGPLDAPLAVHFTSLPWLGSLFPFCHLQYRPVRGLARTYRGPIEKPFIQPPFLVAPVAVHAATGLRPTLRFGLGASTLDVEIRLQTVQPMDHVELEVAFDIGSADVDAIAINLMTSSS